MELVKESNPELTDVVDYEDIYDTVFSPQWRREQPFYIEKGTVYQYPDYSPPPEWRPLLFGERYLVGGWLCVCVAATSLLFFSFLHTCKGVLSLHVLE